jgi:hypothetical protein
MNSLKQRYCLNSNAQIWKEDVFQIITESNSSCYQLIFSVDGLFDKTNNTIRKGSSLEKTKENIFRFIELKNKKDSKIDFGLKMVSKGQDFAEIEDFIFYWLSNKDISFVSFANCMIPEIPFAIRHYPCDVFTNKKGTLGIRYDGSLLVCCYNENAINDRSTYLGNINDYKTITEAFNSDKRNQIRENELKGIFNYPCDKCPIAYCGSGFHGLITFRDEEKRKKIPHIFWHSDSFQVFYSLVDTRNTGKIFKVNE